MSLLSVLRYSYYTIKRGKLLSGFFFQFLSSKPLDRAQKKRYDIEKCSGLSPVSAAQMKPEESPWKNVNGCSGFAGGL